MVSSLLRDMGRGEFAQICQRVKQEEDWGEAAMKESFPETDLCSVQSCQEGKHGGIGISWV